MKHVFPATTTLRRAAGYAGALACTLVLCTACVGGSAANGGTGASGTPKSTGSTSGAGGSGGTNTGGTSTGGTGSGSGSTATAGSGSGTTSTASSGGGSGNGSNSPATCLTRYLGGSVGGMQGTAGSAYVNIVFKNLNNQACTLDGYPGVSLGAGTPVQQVGQPAGRNPQVNPVKVTLQPGGYAYAVLQIVDAGNYPSSTCQPEATTYLQVYPPNDSNLLYIAYSTTGCRANLVTLHVEAVQPGTGS